MAILFIILFGVIITFLIRHLISTYYQTRFEKDFTRIIHSTLKLQPEIENHESGFSKLLQEALVDYKQEIINEYNDSLIDSLLDSKGYSNFCCVVFDDLNESSDDEGVFLLKLNSFINDNLIYPSTLKHSSGFFNSLVKKFRTELIYKFNYSHDFKDELYYEENKKSGVVVRWYDDGTIKEKRTFKKGTEIKIESWYSNGNKKEEGDKKNNDWDTYHREWHWNGQITEEYITDKYQQTEKWSEWSNNGQLLSERNYKYKDRLNHGIMSFYRKTGELSYIEHWFEGKRHGECRYHYTEMPYGIKSIVNYKHGLKHGKYKYFDTKGEVFYETNFVNGSGIVKQCDKYYGFLDYVQKQEDGKIVHEQSFYKNGLLEMERFWENDEIISETFWDEKGNLKKER